MTSSGDRRGQPVAADLGLLAAVLDDHGDRDLAGRCRPARTPMNQACGGAPAALLRGAGLAGHLDAGDLAVGAGAVLDDACHHLGERGRDLRADGRLARAPAGSVVEDRQVGRRGSGRRGRASSARRRWRSRPPPSPSAAGWPGRRAARSPTARSAAASGSAGKPARRRCASASRSAWSKPNFSAWSRSASSPRSMPSWRERGVAGDLAARRSAVGCAAACTAPPFSFGSTAVRLRQVELRGVGDRGCPACTCRSPAPRPR